MALIKGKDRPIEETIEIVKKILQDAGFRFKEDKLLNPVSGIWSIHLKDIDSQFYTNGKGGTKEAAIASAYCEFLERLGSGFFFYDYALKDISFSDNSKNSWTFAPDEKIIDDKRNYKKSILSEKLWDFYNPDDELSFIDFTDSCRCNNDTIVALPFINSNDDNLTYFPIELLKNIYASNGLSAGNSKTETLVQGLSESIERGVKNYIISESLSIPDVSESFLKINNFLPIIDDIEAYGYSVLVKDASLGGRFPVICILLEDKKGGHVLSSFGCHPDPIIAIERTLTELLQGRNLDSMNDFSPLTYNYEQVADEANLESHFINSTGVLHINIIKKCKETSTLWDFNNKSEIDYLTEVLRREDYEYYYRVFSVGKMWISQTIVPKLSEIYPVEDLKVDYKNRSSVIRDILKKETYDKRLVANGLKWFEECYIPGSYNLLEYVGVSVDESESLYNIKADEWELLLLVCKKEFKKVHKLLKFQIIYETISEDRVGLWQSLLAGYEGVDKPSLSVLFNENILSGRDELLKGSIPRNFYPSLGENFSNIKQHCKLENAYLKYRTLID